MTRKELESKLVNMTKKMMVAYAAEHLNIIIKDVKNKPHNKVLDEILGKSVFEEEQETQVPAEEIAEPVELATEVPEIPIETEEEQTEETQEQETEQAEPEAPKPKKKRQKKEMAEDAKNLHNYVISEWEKIGGFVFVPAKEMKFRILKVNGTGCVKYSWSNVSVILQVHSKALGLDAPKNPCNHCYDDKYKFNTDTEEARAEIFHILKTCYDYQICKDLAKEEKKKEKEEKKKTKN